MFQLLHINYLTLHKIMYVPVVDAAIFISPVEVFILIQQLNQTYRLSFPLWLELGEPDLQYSVEA